MRSGDLVPLTIILLMGAAAAGRPAAGQDPAGPDEDEGRPYPILATVPICADRHALATLEKAGTVLFEDGFEAGGALKRYFEVRGQSDGRARIVTDRKIAHSGNGALELSSRENGGKASGAGVSFWFGPEGYDRVHLRTWIRYAADYDQGDLNHTGPGLAGVAGDDKWGGMGGAGRRPRGDDHFSTRLEPWRDWGRFPPPGWLHLYTYWMDMKRAKDGNFWGNMLGPESTERALLERDRWYCLELMVQVNEPGKPDGQLAAWIDGRLYVHYTGIRWRSDANVRLKRFGLDVYVHHATKDNTVWFDDVVLSTGYVGPGR